MYDVQDFVGKPKALLMRLDCLIQEVFLMFAEGLWPRDKTGPQVNGIHEGRMALFRHGQVEAIPKDAHVHFKAALMTMRGEEIQEGGCQVEWGGNLGLVEEYLRGKGRG